MLNSGHLNELEPQHLYSMSVRHASLGQWQTRYNTTFYFLLIVLIKETADTGDNTVWVIYYEQNYSHCRVSWAHGNIKKRKKKQCCVFLNWVLSHYIMGIVPDLGTECFIYMLHVDTTWTTARPLWVTFCINSHFVLFKGPLLCQSERK